MAYDRTSAVEYLNAEFAALAADAGIATDPDGWKTVLDRAFRVSTSDDTDREALLDLYALTSLARALAPRVSISKTQAGTIAAKQRQQAFAQVNELLKLAKENVADLGLLSQNQWQYGSIEMDFTEPNPYTR